MLIRCDAYVFLMGLYIHRHRAPARPTPRYPSFNCIYIMARYLLWFFLISHHAHGLTVHYKDNSCVTHKAVIEEEMQFALDMATRASKEIEIGDYYEKLFFDKLREQPDIKKRTTETFEKINGMVSGTDCNFVVHATCDPDSHFCKNPGYYAHMSDEPHSTMNFCKTFFEPGGEIRGTEERVQGCSGMSLRDAHRSKSPVLIHEMTHTRSAMLGGARYVDNMIISYNKSLTYGPARANTHTD